MTWDYRVIKRDKDKNPSFAIHEVFYDEAGEIMTWTAEPVGVEGDSLKEVKDQLEYMRKDIKTPVLRLSELEAKSLKKPV